MYNIVYSTDDNYCRHVAVSITSLFINNKQLENMTVYIIVENVSDENKNRILKIGEKYERKIILLSCDDICKDLKINTDFPKASFARLFLGKLNIDKILYFDSDTYINGSIEKLYNTDISNFEIAGVQDNAAYYLLKKIGMGKKDRYINSGVLLINLEKWRSNNVEKRIKDFIKQHKGVVNHNDQGIINGVCKKNIYILSPQYNMMPEMIYMTVKQSNLLYNVHNYYTQEEIDQAKKEPIVIHYIEKFYSRPWKTDCTHPMKNKYMGILEKLDFTMELEEVGLNKKIKFRKKVFETMPFSIYVIFEKILNIRRYFLP